jgi:hypothetical protein
MSKWSRRLKRKKQKPEPCPVCGKALTPGAPDNVFKVLMPKWTSREQRREALKRAKEAEERSPSDSVTRSAYRVLAAVKLADTAFYEHNPTELEQVVAGRALSELGGRLVELHPACAIETRIAGDEYAMPDWFEDR